MSPPPAQLGEVGARVQRCSGRGRLTEVELFVARGPLPNLA